MKMASSLHCQRKYNEAEAMYEEVLAVRRRVQGPEHPCTLQCIHLLATVLRDQGKYNEAKAMYQEVLAVQRRVLGPDHPDAVRTAQDLAILLIDNSVLILNF